MKSQKGITLVALVITIIILLILAGITIASLQKTNLFGKAREAANKSENARQNEIIRLNEYEEELDRAYNEYAY